MRTEIFSWLILAVVLASALTFISSLGSGESEKNDPLYVDLMSFPAYVKNGFEPAYASLDDPEMTDWGEELPAGHGRSLLVSGLDANGASSRVAFEFLNPRQRKIKEYTILIPFMIRQGGLAPLYDNSNPVSPGLYMAGVGENWEIHINGNAIARQLHLNPDGEITSFRSRRGLSIPFDRRFLREGKNFLVMHILGAPGSKYTGLFYTSPYYIGDFTRMFNRSESLQTIALCAVYIFLGFYHILLYFLRKADGYNLLFGVFSCVVAVYFFTRCPAVYHVLANTANAQRLEFGALYLLLFTLAAFLETLSFGKPKSVTCGYGISCIAFIVLQSVFPIWFAYDLLTVWHIYGMAFLLYIVYEAVCHFIKQTGEKYAAERAGPKATVFLALIFRDLCGTELGNILIFIILCVCAGIFDILDANFFHTGFFATRYSFFAFMCCMAFTLARKYANRFALTSQMNDMLEATVRQRTHELEEQVLIAKAASRAKGDFLANMSHEIRTPLNAVIGMTKIGALAGDLERKNYAFANIKNASEHLLGIINDILDISKIESGKFELSEVVFRVRDIVSRVKNVTRFKSDEKQQEIAISIADDVPEAICGDDMRIAQVITNLVGNAIKFTPEKGRIMLSANLAGESDGMCTLRFLVEDSGIGITEEQQSKLFTAFQQAESGTTRRYGGTGLGLALSRQIVELMGGTIWVNSVFGHSSIFGFTIQARRAGILPDRDGRADGIKDLRASEFAGSTILLVDDVDINREIVTALLEPSGARIECAGNGVQAVEMFERDPARYNLILMDVQMPIMDGYGATERIRSGHSPEAATIPIVAMSANVFREDIEHCLASGMNEHLGKPVNLEDVLVVLRRYLGKNA
ncbi:MAG: response regulator [Desulfovibrio sp.]|nr:response regulator [Desulfovibrio sp.]